MPIYEYACESCGHVFDVLQKMNADLLQDCPECGKPELKKLLSAPNFRLKGGGWYETDFKKDNQRNLAGDDSGTSKKDTADKKDKKPADTGKVAAKNTDAASKSGSSGTKAE
jgi:putative FmdB family regulatory protein